MKRILLWMSLFLMVNLVQAQSDTIRRVQLSGELSDKISKSKTIKNRTISVQDEISKKVNFVLDTFARQTNFDPFLIPKVKSAIKDVLLPMWREGKILGTTSENFCVIKCGSETMTLKDKEEGRLVLIVSVALKKILEFDTILRFEKIVLNKQALYYF